jgi:hypothetical protein
MSKNEPPEAMAASAPRELPASVVASSFTVIVAALICAAPFLVFRSLPIVLMYGVWSLLGLVLTVRFFSRGARRSAIVAFNMFLLPGMLFGAELGMIVLHDEWVHDTWSEPLTESDAELGTIPRANVTSRHRSYPLVSGYELEWDVTYHIEGDRSRRVPDRPAEGMKLVVLGDSFMFGEGLEDEDQIPNQLQRLLPEYRIFNYAIRGHGTGQNYLYLKRILDRQPDIQLCVVGFIADHVRRTAVPYDLMASDWGRARPVIRNRGGELINLGLASDTLSLFGRLHVDMLARSRAYGRLFSGWRPGPEDWTLVGDLIVAMHDLCSEHHRRFLLVYLPSNPTDLDSVRTSRNFLAWKRRLEDHGVVMVDVAERLYSHLQSTELPSRQFFFPDGHPNRAYSSLAASWISQHITGPGGPLSATGH